MNVETEANQASARYQAVIDVLAETLMNVLCEPPAARDPSRVCATTDQVVGSAKSGAPGEQTESANKQAAGRPIGLARTLALAHRLQGILDQGAEADRASLARRIGFSDTRVSQIMSLTFLAPDIQEQILFAVKGPKSRLFIERDVRPIARMSAWSEQRRAWELLLTGSANPRT